MKALSDSIFGSGDLNPVVVIPAAVFGTAKADFSFVGATATNQKSLMQVMPVADVAAVGHG